MKDVLSSTVSSSRRRNCSTHKKKKRPNTLIEISRLRNDGLDHELAGSEGLTVHVACRKITPGKELLYRFPQHRSYVAQIYKFSALKVNVCFAVAVVLILQKLRNPGKEEWSVASTLHVVAFIRQMAEKRGECEWAKEVIIRLAGVIDLVAEEGRCHRHCYQRF
ncbi:hypothetical protein PR048_006070 [Dryococelus australis]|uniref:Uncharacterized protein n=1 Tax=Dryococelus australis TaxID=614101 RepID=A0ABQ9I9Z0_9NEOP|nr:hypothetical protein PR048_006070 [Dryococelus australis]